MKLSLSGADHIRGFCAKDADGSCRGPVFCFRNRRNNVSAGERGRFLRPRTQE